MSLPKIDMSLEAREKRRAEMNAFALEIARETPHQRAAKQMFDLLLKLRNRQAWEDRRDDEEDREGTYR